MADSTKPEIEAFKPGWRLWCAFISIGIVNLACALDATTVSVALPAISNALHGTAIEALWTGTSFLLASTVCQPNFLSLSDLFGRRALLLVALFLFTLGAILCGVSKNFAVMLVGRCIQGTGVGGIMALSEALIADLVPLRQRGSFLALLSIVWAIGTVAGPLVGGVLAQKHAWRWIFYLNIPIVAIGFVGVVLFLKLEPKSRSLKEKLSEIDYIGSIIFVASLTSFLVPVSWGGVMYSWSSWHTLVPLILGVAGLGVFCIYEIYFATYTIIPMRMFLNRSTSLTYLIAFLHGIILWSIVYYMPLYFMAVLSYTPILAGVAALPQTLTVVPSAGLVGIVAAKTGRYQWSLWIGWTIATLGCGLLYLLGVGTSIPSWIFLLLVSGIGMGLLFPAMNLSIQASVPPKDMPIAGGLFTFFRAYGQGVGVAMLVSLLAVATKLIIVHSSGGVIFQNRMSTLLSAYPDFAHASTDAISLIQQMRSLPADNPQAIILKAAFAGSIKTVWAVMCGLAGLSLIISAFIKEYDLNVAISTDQRFVNQTKVTRIVRVEGDESVVVEMIEGDHELRESDNSLDEKSRV